MLTDLNCPVFKREFEDDITGNMWPLERLAPCKLLSLPHKSHFDNLVVLNRGGVFFEFCSQGACSYLEAYVSTAVRLCGVLSVHGLYVTMFHCIQILNKQVVTVTALFCVLVVLLVCGAYSSDQV